MEQKTPLLYTGVWCMAGVWRFNGGTLFRFRESLGSPHCSLQATAIYYGSNKDAACTTEQIINHVLA